MALRFGSIFHTCDAADIAPLAEFDSIGTLICHLSVPSYGPSILPHYAHPCLSSGTQDPNTGIAMFESAAIVEYLYETYGAKSDA